MSIFKIFEKKKKMEEQRVPIEELDSWLVERINDELRGVYAQGEEIRRRIRDSILSVKQTIEEMVGAASKKGASITAAVDEAADLASTEVLSFEDIVELRERATKDMTQLGEAWNVYKRTVQKDVRSYAVRLYAQWKQIDAEISRLNALINTHSSKATALKRCQEQAGLLMARVKEVREMAEKLKTLENNLQSLESSRAIIEIQIERFKSTAEFEAFLRLRGELSILENRRMEVMSRVHNGFSSLTRPPRQIRLRSRFEQGEEARSRVLHR